MHRNEVKRLMEQEMWEFFNALDSIKRIANHYGLKHQICKAKEELQELYTALLDYQEEDSRKNLKAIITEIADVMIMIEQLKLLMGVNEDVEVEIEYKLNRQLKRIEREK